MYNIIEEHSFVTKQDLLVFGHAYSYEHARSVVKYIPSGTYNDQRPSEVYIMVTQHHVRDLSKYTLHNSASFLAEAAIFWQGSRQLIN
jgi:hypothetical protein